MKRRLLGSTQRFRLAIIAAGWSGVILAILFAGAVSLLRYTDIHAIYSELKPILQGAVREIRQSPDSPDLSEIVEQNPDISIAVFRNGKKVAEAGSIKLEPVTGDRGKRHFGKDDAVYRVSEGPSKELVVAAHPWSGREASLLRLSEYLTILYIPLVFGAGLVTWLASRSTFEPLRQLAAQAETLSATDLSSRLELPGADEYALVATRLNRFLSLIETSVTRQERFIADAAHELRTPLTVLRGQIETTLLRSRSAEDYRKALEVSLHEAERLSRLVDGLLLSASAPASVASPLDLEMAVEKAQARWIDRYQQAGIMLELDLQPCVSRIRPEEFDSIIDNLLSNAFKHSPNGGTVRVSLSENDKWSALVVQDEGAGVPEELRDKIFDRFTRAETSRNREMGGFGIGLAVCRRIVETRKGEMTLEPSPVGARFVVKLPVYS